MLYICVLFEATSNLIVFSLVSGGAQGRRAGHSVCYSAEREVKRRGAWVAKGFGR